MLSGWTGKLLRVLRRWRRSFWLAPRVRSVRVGYEKAGLRVADEPIPWNTEAVFVELLLECGPWSQGGKDEIRVAHGGHVIASADSVEALPEDGMFRATFRLPTLGPWTALMAYCRTHRLTALPLPRVGREAFLAGLQFDSPTVFARLSGRLVPCQALVESQPDGLVVGVLVHSSWSLAPLTDMDLAVDLIGPDGLLAQSTPVPLASFQLLGKRALLSCMINGWTGRAGVWTVCWRAGGRAVTSTSFRVIPMEELQRSLYVVGDGLPRWENPGFTNVDARIPEADDRPRFHFRVASTVAGIAAVCPVEVHLYFKDGTASLSAADGRLLIGDVPALGTPLVVTAQQADRIKEFELSSQGWFLGVVCRQAMPVAHFTGEGGFHSPPEYEWTTFMEAELAEHLQKLMQPMS